jgi:hypothetical protein
LPSSWFAAIGNYVEDSKHRQEALNDMLALRVGSSQHDYYYDKIEKAEAEQSKDGVMGLICCDIPDRFAGHVLTGQQTKTDARKPTRSWERIWERN